MSQPVEFYTLRLHPQGDTADAWPEHTVLMSLEMGGLSWPSSCRAGTCRTCMCKINRGRVRYAMDWPGLSAEEKAEGWILPCVAYPTEDLELQDPIG